MPSTTHHPEVPTSFGDVRRLILETILNIRDGGLDTAQGMVMAANFKCLNDNINAEINAAKLALATEGHAHKFGRVRQMGTNLLTNNVETPDATDV